METDNFTNRNETLALPDAMPILNGYVNQAIQRAINATNKSSSCDPKELYANLRMELDRNPVGEIERYAQLNTHVPKNVVPFKKSIYRNIPGFSLHALHMRYLFKLAGFLGASMKLNDQIVGTDKVGHFFSQGYEYLKNGSLEAAMNYGKSLEAGIYGIEPAGVYSYGDLSANLAGLRFWLRILEKNSPYVKCEKGKYRQSAQFTWADYVTPAWDEAINCSRFVNEKFTGAVKSALKEMNLSCPIKKEACAELVKLPCAYFFVSPACYLATHTKYTYDRGTCLASFRDEINDCPSCNLKSRKRNAIDKLDELWGTVTFPLYVLDSNEVNSEKAIRARKAAPNPKGKPRANH